MARSFKIPTAWQKEIDAGTKFGKRANGAICNLRADHPHLFVEPVTPVSQIGTRLAMMFGNHYGAIICSECAEAIKRLDGMTVEEVAVNRKQIVADIASRARFVIQSRWLLFLIGLDVRSGLWFTRRRIGLMLDASCEAERR